MKKLFARRLSCLVLCFTMLLPTLLLTSCSEEEESFDFMKEDLGAYITFNYEDYLSKAVSIKEPDVVDDLMVNSYIRQLLVGYGVDVYLKDQAVQEGDVVSIFYRATEEKDGKTVDVVSNFQTSAVDYSLTKDTLGFGNEFNEMLIGISDEYTFEQHASGKIERGQVLYVTYSYNYKAKDQEGKEKWTTVTSNGTQRWNLEELEESKEFGEGFVDLLIGKDIGKSYTLETYFDVNGDGEEEKVTFNASISLAVEENPYVFTLSYPDDYKTENFKGKDITFYVCVKGVAGTAEQLLTEDILKNKFKYEPKEDDEYKDDLVTSFIKMTEETLVESRKSQIKNTAINTFWDNAIKALEVKKYPESVVDNYYESSIAEVRSYYDQYKEQVGVTSLNDFVISFYGLPEDTKYETYFRDKAKETVKYWLAYYTIVRGENIVISDAEFKEKRADYLASFIYDKNITYYQQYGEWADYTEKDLLDVYGKEYLDATLKQSMLNAKLNDFLYENMTIEYTTEDTENEATGTEAS